VQEEKVAPTKPKAESHCHDKEALGARQSIKRAPPNKEAEGNQQG
jgi:hypothetical protein